MKNYDDSWDKNPIDEEAWDKKWEEWERRDWNTWLNNNLTFPFMATREEDEDDAYFTYVAEREPFRLGAKMEIVGLEGYDDFTEVFLVKAKQGRRTGVVPLCDIEVTSKDDPNYWIVREYVVWFANR